MKPLGRIHVLKKQVAELIAAGEVVERPASAVKELLENSIDSGADAVTVEIKNGGVSFIRVADNGCGIAAADVPTAFIRHATSKILTAEDLDAIATLGFRGEALASIAAVSHCQMLTRTKEELAGTHAELEGGEIISQGEAGCPQGTTIIVRDLFFNTPARMKFLKKDVSEANAVRAVVERVALSHPEVSIRFLRDGREELHTPGDGKLLSAIFVVYGRQFASNLLAVEYEHNGITVRGFVSKPIAARSNRSMQMFFLNGRLVRSKTAAAALEEAYKNQIMVGKFPACVLDIGLNPGLVDVNVHPAKLEVRFSNEREIFETVYYGVKNAIGENDTRPELGIPQKQNVRPVTEKALANSQLNLGLSKTAEKDGEIVFASSLFSTASAAYEPMQNEAHCEPSPARMEAAAAEGPENAGPTDLSEPPVPHPTAAEPVPMQAMPTQTVSPRPFRVVGECFGTYIVAETSDEIWIIDKHAAHERILYDDLKAHGESDAQLLLEPVSVPLSREEYGALMENLSPLRAAGFEIEDFGGSSVLVREAPMTLPAGEIASSVQELAAAFLENRRDLVPARIERIYHSVACRAAIKAGDKNATAELEAVASRVMQMDDIRYCPHGRPVAFILTRGDLEKQFGRA